MKILMALREDFPPDVRIVKEVSRLQRDGHEVTLVCSNRKRLAHEETIDGMHVKRLPFWPSAFRKAHTLFNNLPYENPAWFGFIVSTAKEIGADALHVHDLPLVKTVLKAGRKLDLPVVFDMHENWAELLPSVPRRVIERLLATRHTFGAVEREVCMAADTVIVVVQESKERLKALGIPADKIFVVPNVVDLELIPEEFVGRPPDSGSLEFIYAGGLSLHRGLDVLLEAFKPFSDKEPDARLTIGGTGPQDQDLRHLAKRLGLDGKVEFPGWLDFPTYLERISLADVGLVPHVSTPHTDSTLPHKLFHYMAMKKPVIVGDAIPLERIVNSTRSGLVARSGDVESMLEALSRLASSEALRHEMGENGYRAVHEQYNWDEGVKPLLDLYRRLGS